MGGEIPLSLRLKLISSYIKYRLRTITPGAWLASGVWAIWTMGIIWAFMIATYIFIQATGG